MRNVEFFLKPKNCMAAPYHQDNLLEYYWCCRIKCLDSLFEKFKKWKCGIL